MNRWKLGLTLGLLLGAYASGAAAADPPFAAPSGFQGAGLGMGDQKGRAWLETAFHTQERVTVFGTTLGAGYRVAESLELEAMLPFAFVSIDRYTFDDATYAVRSERETAFALGNPYLGINRVHLDGAVRYKAGLGVTLPVAADDDAALSAVTLSAATYGLQDMHLWWPDTFAIAAPLRIEAGDQVVAGIDAMPTFYIFTNDDSSSENELVLQLAPGLGVYATDTLLIGARLPVWWVVTNDEGDSAQVALEPYARLDVGSGFLNARFTVNLDEPLGFAFDEYRFWGAHLGGGLVF